MDMFSHQNSIIREVRHSAGIIVKMKRKSTVDYFLQCFSHAEGICECEKRVYNIGKGD